MNPYIIETMLHEKREEMLQEAKRLRLIAAYNKHTQTQRAKVLSALGARLIRAGEKLQQRYGERVELPAG